MERDVFPDRRGSDHPGQQTIGPRLGGVVQLHVYLDDIFPNSIGKPISRVVEMSKAIAAVFAANIALTAAAPAARAHAFLDHASPAVGSTVATPPQQLRLSFTQGIEPGLSLVISFVCGLLAA